MKKDYNVVRYVEQGAEWVGRSIAKIKMFVLRSISAKPKTLYYNQLGELVTNKKIISEYNKMGEMPHKSNVNKTDIRSISKSSLFLSPPN